MRRRISIVLIGLGFAITLGAQSKAPVTRADYGQWESLAPAGARGGFSPDAAWLAYAINRSNRNNELRLVKLADGTTKTAAFGSQPVFSADSKWAAYSIGYSEADLEKMRVERRPVHNKLGLVSLASGETTTIDGIQSFSFSSDGAYLAMRRYPPSAPGATGAAGAPTPPAPAPPPGGRGGGTTAAEEDAPGVTMIIRDLATGRDTTFGNVSDYVWQNTERSHLLGMTISAESKVGNGVHLFDPQTTVLRVLDSAAATYSGPTWRKDSTDLVVLRAKADENDKRDGPTHVALAWRQLGAASEKRAEFEPLGTPGLAPGLRTVSFRRPSWSEDGRLVFLGIAKWEEKKPGATGATGAAASAAAGPAASAGQGAPKKVEVDEPAGVDIWHWNDVEVMARQKLSATADRRRNLLAAWHLDTGKFVPIGKAFTESVAPIARTSLAYVEEWGSYAMDRTIGRPAADLYLADLASGDRTKIKERVDDRYAQVSPGGRFVLFLQDDQYWTIDLASRVVKILTKAVPTSFVDLESDVTVKQKPPYGVAGWDAGDRAVILYDKFDLWRVPTDGARATRLTDGAAEQVRHRYVRLNPDEESIDLQKPAYLSVFGVWTKKSGYAILRAPGAAGATGAAVERLVWLDKSVGSLGKAKDADVYAYIAQDYDDSPDLFVGGPTLGNARQVTTTNAFHNNFLWGRSEVVEYKTEKGQRLQGALYYPAGYEPGVKYPMVVYLYEKLSDGVHRYVAPSDREYYNASVFTTQGYLLFQPDIVFRPREPGVSVVECVTAAVKRVIDLGIVDPKRIGVIGHSWGGFDAAFLATHGSVFAAAVAGAPITDLVSNYGNHHWSSGIAETDHIETGQQRMEVPLWEDFQAYVRNSAVFNVQNMTTPLLIEVGDSDGTVFWHQGVELYNIARRAKRNVVMLVYGGEDHGLRQKKNQVDYQRRILEWFGHYLKGEPPPTWIASGQSYLK